MKEYKTKQRELILNIFTSNESVTADEICEKLYPKVNRSTVYRNLEKLTESGKLIKEVPTNGNKSIYKLNHTLQCNGHLHLICNKCGGVLHLSDETSEKLEKILCDDCGFFVNDQKTMIYGICDNCLKELK